MPWKEVSAFASDDDLKAILRRLLRTAGLRYRIVMRMKRFLLTPVFGVQALKVGVIG